MHPFLPNRKILRGARGGGKTAGELGAAQASRGANDTHVNIKRERDVVHSDRGPFPFGDFGRFAQGYDEIVGSVLALHGLLTK